MAKNNTFSTNKTHLKAFCCIFLMLCIVMLTPVLVSSANFDNVKSDLIKGDGISEYGKIEIKDWFGLQKLTDLELKENTDTCISSCSAITEIIMYQSGALVDDIKFLIQSGEDWKPTTIKDYTIYIQTGTQEIDIEDYEQQCSNKLIEGTKNNSMSNDCSLVKTGTHKETENVYEVYTLGTTVPIGTYNIKIEGKKNALDTIDWQITSQGKLIDEWAIWGSSLQTNLLNYFKLDTTTGTIAVDSMDFQNGTGNGIANDNWITPGALNGAIRLNGVDEWFSLNTNDYKFGLQNFSISFWMNTTDDTIQFLMGTDNGVAGGMVVKFDGDLINVYDSGLGDIEFQAATLSGLTDGAYHHYVLVRDRDGTNSKIYIDNANKGLTKNTPPNYNANEIFSLGCAENGATACLLPLNGTLDEVGIWNRSLTSSEISDLYNGGTPLAFSDPDTVITLNSPNDYLNSSIAMIEHNATAVAGLGRTIANMSLISNQSGTFVRTNSTTGLSGTTESYKYNLTYTEGVYDWYYESCDNTGACFYSTENRTITVDSTAPAITINLPTSLLDYGYLGVTENLSWSIVETNIDSYWYEYNNINTTLTNGVINSTTFTLGTSPYNITIYANDSVNNIASTYINWSYRLFNSSETYTASTISGTTNPFILNLQTNGTQITAAKLVYNGTSYLGSINSTGNDYTLTKNQIAPGVTTTTNIPFYWNITMSDGFNQLTTSKNQSVSGIVINETCVNMYTIFNFTSLDEITQAKLIQTDENTSIKIDLNLYSSDRTTQLVDYFHNFNKINPAAICLDNDLSGGEQYSLDIQVEYLADDYSTEFYNIEKYVLNSSTLGNNISLYNLATTNTQSFKLLARDTSYLPIDGALIQIQRKYLENGTFYITEIPKTDEKGITSASLQVDSVIYNFYIYDDGTLISSFTNVLAICQTPLVTQCEIDFNAFQTEIVVPDYETIDDFNFTLGYNSSTRVVSSQFVIPSGSPSAIQLVVTKEDALGTSVCSDTLTSASGIVSCIVPANFGNATVMAKLYKDSSEIGKGNIKIDQKSSDIFGVVLTFLSVLVIITLIGIGVSDNPIVTAVFLFVGVVVLFGINLVQNTGFIGASATILFFAIAIILVIIKAARRN